MPQQEQAAPPPELMAMLGGGGGAPSGPPPEQDLGPEPAPQASAVDHLRQAIEHAQAALQLEPDDADSQNLAKVVQGLYAILAGRQKEHESLMGGGNMRALSRASQ